MPSVVVNQTDKSSSAADVAINANSYRALSLGGLFPLAALVGIKKEDTALIG